MQRIVFLDQFGAIRTRGSGIRSRNESQTRGSTSMTLESTGVLRASQSYNIHLYIYQSAAEPHPRAARYSAEAKPTCRSPYYQAFYLVSDTKFRILI